MKKNIILLFACIVCLTTAQAQMKQNYRQFFFNPYLFNPAFASVNGKTEVNMNYRKQWMNFNDSPTITGVNLQVSTSDKVALAFNLASETNALLRNTSLLGTFAYAVPIDKNQSLRFGLSAGAGMKKFDLTADELNTNDQAILNAASTNYYIDGNFGFAYINSGLKLGISLTELFKSDPLQNTSNEFKVSNLNNRIYSASYRFHLDRFERFSMEPYVLYHESADKKYNAWEAASTFYYFDKLWTGAGYHQQKGVSLFFGVNIMEKFRFSYNYEFPSFQSNSPSFSSHELQLTIRLGRNKHTNEMDYSSAEPTGGME